LAIISGSFEVLEGLMFLALPKSTKSKNSSNLRIVGAGEYDSEYQTWLVIKNKEVEFLPKAFELIFREFPNCKIIFRFIPEVSDLHWIYENDYWKNYCVVQPYKRPLMQMSHPNFNNMLNKRHLKAKYNRFIKAGKVELEEIQDSTNFKKIYEEAMILYDFRQGALFNKIPSERNSLRKQLFFSLFDKNILHVSVLRLDKQITSCIIGMKNEKWMHLSGLITYSPFYSKLSPGLVHLYLLGKLLKDQGYSHFDLTPGYDVYKERLATNADEVFELTLSKNHRHKIKSKLRKVFHEFLLSRNIRPMSFNLTLQKLKHRLTGKIFNAKRIFPFQKNSGNTQVLKDSPIKIQKNNIIDLLGYKGEYRRTRWEFLEDAFYLVESGESFYSWSHSQILLGCIWTRNANVGAFGNGEQKKCLDINSAYLNPIVKARKEEFLKKVEEY